MLRNGSAEGATPQPMVVFNQVMCFTDARAFRTPGVSDFVAFTTAKMLILFFTARHNGQPSSKYMIQDSQSR